LREGRERQKEQLTEVLYAKTQNLCQKNKSRTDMFLKPVGGY